VTPGLEIPRPELLSRLAERIRRGGPPILLSGPPGAGKTTLLRELAGGLARDDWAPVYLDLMGAASSPDRFVKAALRALPAEWFGRRLQQATEIRRLADAGRLQGAAAVQALFAFWSTLDEAGGRPVALLLDEATEIRSLAYFAGLREVDGPFRAALDARKRGTVLATSFPTLARRLWPDLESVEAGPLRVEDLAGLVARAVDRDALVRASFGWPRYLRILLERAADGTPVETAWVEEMGAGGRLEAACRHTYESLLLRSRGYGMSKAVLAAVADEEGLNLTALVARIGRTPGAVRDYLQWLVGVDALRMTRKRYHYVDGLLCLWVRLHARGVPASADEIRKAARGLAAEVPPGEAAAPPPPVAAPARHDSLMEID
jgi:DNA polymerase III delta prime subunit